MSKKIICFITLMFIFSCSNLFAGNSPFNELDDLEFLGKNLYNDKNLSINNNQSCKSCHHNKVAFVDPANVKNPSKNVVSNGSVPSLTGGLNAPTAGYATYSPKMYWDGELYIGGQFWNGRAAGHKEFMVFDSQTEAEYSPLAEQAQGPFLNPVEMGLPSKAEVVYRVSIADYAYLFARAFGAADFNDIELTYDQIGYAIAAFESTEEFTKFNSDFDNNVMTEQAKKGELLFNGKAQCSACHITEPGDSGHAEFTDYSYDNLGAPLNPIIADKGVDPGLGGFILTIQNDPDALPSLKAMVATAIQDGGGSPEENYGKHKVSTLRNIAQTPPYAHNGFFPNLTSIVQFYNTRDVYKCSVVGGIPVTPALLEKGFIPGYPTNQYNGYCWPAPEKSQNVNTAELGNLGLSSSEVDQIVTFMDSLSDN